MLLADRRCRDTIYLLRAFYTLAPVSARTYTMPNTMGQERQYIYFCQINQFALETQNNGIMTVAATSLLFRVWIPVLVNRSCSIRGVWALGARPDRKSALTLGQILSQLQGELHNLVRLALNYIS